MTRDLREAVQRFSAAASTRIMHKGISWSEFSDFLASSRQVEQVASSLVLPEAAGNALQKLRIVRRKLRTIPISPSAGWLGLTAFIEEPLPNFGQEVDQAFAACRSTGQQLIDSGEHPVVSFLTERVETTRRADPKAVIHVVVSRENVDDMVSLNDLHRWGLSVTTVTGAKRVDTGSLCLILGMPESLVGGGRFGKPMEDAQREIAWLFNAPIARDVCVVSWPGCRPFQVDRYGIFPGLELTLTSSTGPNSFDPSLITDLVIPTQGDEAEQEAEDDGAVENTVEARRIWLCGGLFVDYAVGNEGPRANRIVESDFELAIEDVSVLSRLQMGDLLVVRGGETARRFLEAEAARWLTEKHGPNEPGKCKAVRERFRDGVLKLERDAGAMPLLRALGLTDEHVFYRFRLAHDTTHIAPEEFTTYKLISGAFGDEVTDEDWSHVRHLRSAMKRAGRIARKKMEEKIALEQSWMATVDIPDVATLDMGDLGTLLISRIIKIEDHPRRVPISRLGDARWSTK